MGSSLRTLSLRLTRGAGLSLCLLLVAGCSTVPRGFHAGCIQHTEQAVFQEGSIEPVADTLRIGTYNIQDLTDGEGESYFRTPSVTRRQVETAAAIITDSKPDILVIQEIENAAILKTLNSQIDPPYPLAYITQFDENGRGTKRNIAILSRVPLQRVNELDFACRKGPVQTPRGALVFLLELGQGHYLLGYGVHLKSNMGGDEARPTNVAKRMEALRMIREHADLVQRSNPDLVWEVLVAGDMNVDPELEGFMGDRSLAPLSDWNDLWLGRPLEERITIPARRGDPDLEFPSACFDRVIVSPELAAPPWQAGSIEVLQRGVDTENVFTRAGQNEIHASDHFPVFVDLVR